jgi:hypothetical protein
MTLKTKRKTVQFARVFCDVRPNLNASHYQTFGKLRGRWVALRCLFYQSLENLFRRRAPGANGHVNLASSKPFFIFYSITWCSRQTMSFFEHLSQINGLPSLPLSVPHAAVQPDPTGNNVHMVMVSVVVPDGEKLVLVAIETHAVQVIVNNGLPAIIGQVLTRRQRQRGMPDRPGNVGAQLAGDSKFFR